MHRPSIVVPAVAVCALAFAAGCGSTSNSGAGALTNVPTSAVTMGSSPTAAGTTKPPQTKPTATKNSTPTSSWPTPEDCVSYDPSTLTVDGDASSGTFVISDGTTIVMRLHGQSDDVGKQGLALAQRYTKHCYIGRGNTRDDKGDYIFDYWRGSSGMTTTIPGEDDLCSPYNNKNLTVEDMGDGNGWRVKDHDHVLHVFDNGTDARNGNVVLLKYTQVCQIGDIDSSDNDLGSVTYQR